MINDNDVYEEKRLEERISRGVRKARTTHLKSISITPPTLHYVDISVVESETIFNLIGIILITLGLTFIGGKTIPLYVGFVLLILGIIIYLFGKLYLYYKIKRHAIPLTDYYHGLKN